MRPFNQARSSEQVHCSADLFLKRLQLAVVMSKAFLKGLPLGKYRKEAIVENANELFYMALMADQTESHSDSIDDHIKVGGESSSFFYRKVQRLSVLARAYAEGRLNGEEKRKALSESVESICETITFKEHIDDIGFLNLAFG